MLLRACGLHLGNTGWNFCPAASPAPLAEVERHDLLLKRANELERELANKRLACADRPKPPPPPLELPRQTGTPRPQQTALLKPPPPPPPPKPPPPPPALPADRWQQGDLGILNGCWLLGHETQSKLTHGGASSELCTVRTGEICFDSRGGGQRRMTMVCPSQRGPISCVAPVTGSFAAGVLRTTQPQVLCSDGTIQWNGPQNTLTCQRQSDTMAMCRDGLNFPYEFRRGGP